MKKILFFVFVLAGLLIASGCQPEDQETRKLRIAFEASGETQEAEKTSKITENWCREGTEWETEGFGGSSKMIIVGMVESGEYKGYCHVKYDIDSDVMTAKVDYYFNEEGDGYQVMEVNGQRTETAWEGQG